MNIRKLFFATICAFAFLIPERGEAQNYERLSDYEQRTFGEKVFVDGTDYASAQTIRKFWQKEVASMRLGRSGEYALVGNDLVLKVTLPANLLFLPCDTVRTQNFDAHLNPILRLVRGDRAYVSLIVACSSDNNGSETYLTRFTQSRAASIANWFKRQGVSKEAISNYGLADHCPKTSNLTLRDRASNRRITLYLVPNKQMVKLAKRGKL